MKIQQLQQYLLNLFDKQKLERFKSEYGFYIGNKDEIKKIGYSTNLTPETIAKAIENNVDFIITHHETGDFLYEMNKYCMNKLAESNISYFFVHAPLDDADFGTNASLMNKLGAKITEKTYLYSNTFSSGRIGKLDNPVEFSHFVKTVEGVLDESVKAWKNNDRMIKRIGVVTGSGIMPDYIKMMVEKNCDVYITGEKALYTVVYAKFLKLNLIVGSHTYTELFGVESLCRKITDRFNDVEIVWLKEEHFE